MRRIGTPSHATLIAVDRLNVIHAELALEPRYARVDLRKKIIIVVPRAHRTTDDRVTVRRHVVLMEGVGVRKTGDLLRGLAEIAGRRLERCTAREVAGKTRVIANARGGVAKTGKLRKAFVSAF